ncbi:MAG: hypothetical protein CL920_27825 [Deltaproteobacteria bacterium]|nr:hypothetical protein [Deltaproteobacteria bacterium]|tara:strand:- start:283 stop:1515 length:1233 start_codon:yes stop_codon:yes gene_type:complete
MDSQSRFNSIFSVLFLAAIFFLSGCAVGPDSFEPTSETLSTKKQKLHHSGPIAYASQYSGHSSIPHGIAGDRDLVFVTEPLLQRVVVVRRSNQQQIAVLPAPSGGMLLPFAMRMKTFSRSGCNSTGRVVVLDSGGFPSPTMPAIPRIYEYDYTFNRNTGAFQATLQRNLLINTVPIGFSEEITLGQNGDIFLTDSVLGSIWRILPDNSVVPGITPASFAPQDAIPQLGGCGFPQGVQVDGIDFALPGGFAPGVGSMTTNSTHLFFGNTCTGGVYKVPLSVFTDNRAPHLRAADITVVSARPSNVAAEALKGLNFNKYNCHDKYLYATDALQLQVIRINIQTGARQVVVKDNFLLNFPVAAVFLPSRRRFSFGSELYVVSDQEHRLAALNAALTEDIFQTPFLVTKVKIYR